MRSKKSLLLPVLFGIIALLITSQVNARQVSIGSNDLPYTASTPWDTITFNSSKITSLTNGIYVTANNVTINLQNDTLEFGTNYSDDVNGIYTSYHVKGLVVLGTPEDHNGGLILHGGGTGTTDSSWGCSNIRTLGGATDNVTVTNVDMEIYGWDGHNYYHDDGRITNLTISGGRLIDHVDGFTNRCYNTGNSILLPRGDLVMHDVTIDSWAHGFAGGGLVEIYNCSLLIDVKNDLYSYPSSSTCESSIGGGGIDLWIADAGTKIHDNVIIAGIENEGCAGGIGLSYSVGTESNPIEIYNNYTDLHRGPDDHYGGVSTRPYKQRWGNKYIYVYNNEFYASAHSDSGSHAQAWGLNCEGIEICFSTGAYGEEGAFCDSFTIIENNHVEAVALDANSRGVGMRLSVRNELHDYDFIGAGNVFRNNYFGSSTSGVEFGKGDCGIANSVVLNGDTIASIGVVDPNYHTYESGDWGGPSIDNVVRDMVYLGQAAEDDIYWDTYGAGSDISFERTLQIYAVGNNDTAIVNASYTIKNESDQIISSGSTNSNGIDTAFVKYFHAFMSSPDILNNNLTIIVEKSGFSDTVSLNVDGQSSSSLLSPIFYLNTPGTGSNELDTIPPAIIDSLKADTGAFYNSIDGSLDSSTIKLSWLATGDDAKEGWATFYTIKYSTDSVIQSDWIFLQAYPNSMTPDSSGRPENLVINHLTPGQKYYFGIIATDEAGNSSDIADASGFARGILVPDLIAGSLQTDQQLGEATLFSSIVNSYVTIDYEFQIATDSFFSNPTTLQATNLTSTTASVVFSGLSDGVEYYSRSHAVATSQSMESAWSATLKFNLTGIINSQPSTPLVYSPLKGDTVTSLTPYLTITNSNDVEGDILTYDFELYDTTTTSLLSSASNITETNQTTSWRVPEGVISDSTWYAWRARGYDGNLYSSWSAYSYFYVRLFSSGFAVEDAEIIAYPAPVHFRDGEQITFKNLPNSSVELTILTTSGEVVLHKVGMLDSWSWNGLNAAGSQVATGIYLWYLQVESNTFSGKIVSK